MNHEPENSSATCWTLIRDASAGGDEARTAFVNLYEPVVFAYLKARWERAAQRVDLDDAAQDVFVECLRPAGALAKADPDRGGFRGYLYGVVRHVALRYESRRKSLRYSSEPHADESSLGQSFDREFARAIMKEALRMQSGMAQLAGDAAIKRLELLRLRFHEKLPIRVIAEQWNFDPAKLHHEYAAARNEFRIALRSVVQFHHPEATDAQITDRCTELIECLK